MNPLILAGALLLSACASSVLTYESFTPVPGRPVDIQVRGADEDAVRAMREVLLDRLPLPGGGAALRACESASACHILRVEIVRADGPHRVATALLGVFAGDATVEADVYIDGRRRFSVSGSSAYGNAFVNKVSFAAKEAAARIVEVWNAR